MSQPTVGEIFRLFGATYLAEHGQSMPTRQHRAMRALQICRTRELGGHVVRCDSCDITWHLYNSCRNRHCPTCQGMATLRWLAAQEAALLPVRYFHVVFTLPAALYEIALRNQEVVYNILFRAAKETLLTLARDPKHLGAEIGFTAVLHTWNQLLFHHPHLHCLVPSGGIDSDGWHWRSCRRRFFMPWPVIAPMFRGKVLDYLGRAYAKRKLVFPGKIAPLGGKAAFDAHLDPLYHIDFVGYCQAPVGGPEHVLAYLGRYIHRVAISDYRILSVDADQITFSYLDRKDDNKQKTQSLTPSQFIGRFLLHILPQGFVKIRHFGILANRNRKEKIALARKLIHRQGLSYTLPTTFQDLLKVLTGDKAACCPTCGKGPLMAVEIIPRPTRAPPHEDKLVA